MTVRGTVGGLIGSFGFQLWQLVFTLTTNSCFFITPRVCFVTLLLQVSNTAYHSPSKSYPVRLFISTLKCSHIIELLFSPTSTWLLTLIDNLMISFSASISSAAWTRRWSDHLLRDLYSKPECHKDDIPNNTVTSGAFRCFSTFNHSCCVSTFLSLL